MLINFIDKDEEFDFHKIRMSNYYIRIIDDMWLILKNRYSVEFKYET